MKSTHKGFKRLYNSLVYSIAGLKSTWKHEEAFRVECLVGGFGLLSMPLIIDNYVEFFMLITSFAIVLIAELLNSAVESLVDRVGQEFHELSGRAKDQGSAAVFIALVLAGMVWLLVAIN